MIDQLTGRLQIAKMMNQLDYQTDFISEITGLSDQYSE
jgi:hypothetical protein